ncbi:S8 family serine peptidase, partial [Vibrio parahaemolyticus]|uniref:S8 family serine peptidase n=1 Tax=Vibrio parahaemolyticus TaxID=670 RepID=UPI002111B409
LAATQNAPGEEPTFGILSGTSMSSPHVAGLGALYLGERPKATPAEVKSAMMTTAYDTVLPDGSPNTNPFEQGAGHVDPTRFFNPGL